MDIEPLRASDRAAWEELARGYKALYRTPVPDEGYERTWRQLHDATSGRHGVGARLDGRLVGIAHYLFHDTFWSAASCYPQDLFVDEAASGHGAARALIEHSPGSPGPEGPSGSTGPPSTTTPSHVPSTTSSPGTTASSATTSH